MKMLILSICLLLFQASHAQARYDLIIDEVMLDPSPVIGMPNYEWVELKNIGTNPVNLKAFRLIDEDGQSGPFPNYDLKPDSFLVVCGSSALASLQIYGSSISLSSFPSLDNAQGMIGLQSADGRTIHSISYSDEWYQNDLKREGGWTLEMVDTKLPCIGMKNWKASVSEIGGSPGKANSVASALINGEPPTLQNAWFADSIHIILEFDKQLDSASSTNLSNYSGNEGLAFNRVTNLAGLLDQVQVSISSQIESNKIYQINVRGIKDCAANELKEVASIRIGRPSDPAKGDWIINEILFNPRSGGYDFVEFYNNSAYILDATRLFIANRNSGGTVSSIKVFSNKPHYIFPGDYIVVTENLSSLQRNYLVPTPLNVLPVQGLASFPDDEGDVIALNFHGEIVDELKYNKDWHFKLIANAEGVSLERINAAAPTEDRDNWHSSSSTDGYATPTYKNSQSKIINQFSGQFAIEPKIISPDGDGYNDIATISYSFTEPGYVANISIFDAKGRPVKILVGNALLGMNGHWNWDGLNDRGAKLPAGVYVVLTEFFNLQGKKSRFKNAIILAGERK